MPPQMRFRFRRLSRVTGGGADDDASSSHLVGARTSICQAAGVNPLFPGVTRTFEELPATMLAAPAVARVVRAFRAAAGLASQAPVDVHAIRTRAAADGAGAAPAPEGIHRAGVRALGIFVVGRANVAGGVTELHARRDGAGEPLLRAVLAPGEGVLVNDREPGGVYHFTGPIQSADGAADGTRDVLVLLC